MSLGSTQGNEGMPYTARLLAQPAKDSTSANWSRRLKERWAATCKSRSWLVRARKGRASRATRGSAGCGGKILSSLARSRLGRRRSFACFPLHPRRGALEQLANPRRDTRGGGAVGDTVVVRDRERQRRPSH